MKAITPLTNNNIMNKKELFALKYYIGFCIAVLAFYVYSGLTGYRWFNPTKTEPGEHRPRTGTGAYYRYYHK